MLLDELRAVLAKSDKTLTDIADAAGMHRVSLSRFKGGGRGVPVDTAEKIAAIFGYEIVLKKIRKKT